MINMAKNIAKKIIIFDMDGVIFDSVDYARKFFIENHPGVSAEMYNEIHADNYYEGIKKYAGLRITLSEAKKKKSQSDYASRKSRLPIFPKMKSLLENLRTAGYLLVLNSNAYSRNCLPMLERNGLDTMFDFISTADLSKSKIEKFILIKGRYRADSQNILFITDALGDLKEAAAAGLRTIAVTWGIHNRSFFEREKHDNLIAICDTVEELNEAINKNI